MEKIINFGKFVYILRYKKPVLAGVICNNEVEIRDVVELLVSAGGEFGNEEFLNEKEHAIEEMNRFFYTYGSIVIHLILGKIDFNTEKKFLNCVNIKGGLFHLVSYAEFMKSNTHINSKLEKNVGNTRNYRKFKYHDEVIKLLDNLEMVMIETLANETRFLKKYNDQLFAKVCGDAPWMPVGLDFLEVDVKQLQAIDKNDEVFKSFIIFIKNHFTEDFKMENKKYYINVENCDKENVKEAINQIKAERANQEVLAAKELLINLINTRDDIKRQIKELQEELKPVETKLKKLGYLK